MMTVPYVAQAADQEQLPWLGGGIMRILLDGTRTGGQVSLVRSAPPRGAASPVHVHEKDDEIIVLLRGSGLFWSGDQRFELSAGGVAFLPRGLPHTYLFTSDDADMLAVCTPSGMEDFFRTAAAGEITPERMAEAAAATGQVILGPPLGAGDEMPGQYLARS